MDRGPKPLYAQLRPLRNGPGRESVSRHQRARLCGAMVASVASDGYAGTSVVKLARLAGVSRQTLYVEFGSKEACFLATYDHLVQRAAARIANAYGGGGDAGTRLARAFAAFASEVVGEPAVARLLLVEALGAGPGALARMQRSRVVFARMVRSSFDADEVASSPLVAMGIVCGVERVTRRRLLTGRSEELPALAGELSAWAMSYRSPAVIRLAGASVAPRGPAVARAQARGERARILGTAARIAARDGYAQLTAGRIARDAGVDDEVFEALYDSAEQCFLDALDRRALEALVCTVRAARGSPDRLVAVHRGMTALMCHLASDPVLVRIAFMEIFAVGPSAIERRERLLARFSDLLFDRLPAGTRPSDLMSEAIVGAVWGLVHQLVGRDRADLLPGLADQATYLALAPAIGAEDAVESVLRARRSLA